MSKSSSILLFNLIHKPWSVVVTLSQNLTAERGDQKSLLELGGSLSVSGNSGPVIWPLVVVESTGVDHWFNGERVSGLHDSGSIVFGIMRDVRRRVEQPMNSVSTVTLDYRETVEIRVLLDDVADFAEFHARFHNGDGLLKTLPGDLDQLSRLFVDFVTDEERLVEVSMESAVVDGDVDIAQISILQLPHVWNSVTNDLIHRGATALRELVVSEWTRIAISLDRRLMNDAIQLVGGNPWLTGTRRLVQTLSAEFACQFETLLLLIGQNLDDSFALR